MKNSALRILIAAVFTLLLIPQVSLAVWWKPADWLRSEKVLPKPDVSITASSSSLSPSSSVREIIKEVPVEKIVVKTEYRDNPDLLVQIASLKAQLAQCKYSESQIVNTVSSKPIQKTVSSACKGYTVSYEKWSGDLEELKAKYKDDLDHYAQFAQTAQIKSLIEKTSDEYNLSLAGIMSEYTKAKEAMNLQCQ